MTAPIIDHRDANSKLFLWLDRDGVQFNSLRSVATFVGRAESTISDRFLELGRRHATLEELTKRKQYFINGGGKLTPRTCGGT